MPLNQKESNRPPEKQEETFILPDGSVKAGLDYAQKNTLSIIPATENVAQTATRLGHQLFPDLPLLRARAIFLERVSQLSAVLKDTNFQITSKAIDETGATKWFWTKKEPEEQLTHKPPRRKNIKKQKKQPSPQGTEASPSRDEEHQRPDSAFEEARESFFRGETLTHYEINLLSRLLLRQDQNQISPEFIDLLIDFSKIAIARQTETQLAYQQAVAIHKAFIYAEADELVVADILYGPTAEAYDQKFLQAIYHSEHHTLLKTIIDFAQIHPEYFKQNFPDEVAKQLEILLPVVYGIESPESERFDTIPVDSVEQQNPQIREKLAEIFENLQNRGMYILVSEALSVYDIPSYRVDIAKRRGIIDLQDGKISQMWAALVLLKFFGTSLAREIGFRVGMLGALREMLEDEWNRRVK